MIEVPMISLARLTAIVGSLFGLCSIGLAHNVATNEAESLVGLWGAEQILVPMVSGELSIDARYPSWRASIAGFDAAVEHSGDRVSFTLPGGQGEFRGRITPNSKNIRGHWIQQSSINPYNQRYASPVELVQVSADVWRGRVTPLEYRVSLYLSIDHAKDGTLTAFIKNPEANFFARRTYTVELKGDSLALAHPDVPEAGTYDRETDRIFIPLLNSYPPLAFTRRKGRNAIGFYPQIDGQNGKYVYRSPVAKNDGWATASLSDVGLDEKGIGRLIEKIRTAVPSPENPVNIHSLLIARHGKLVFEEYFYGSSADRTHDMRSASKTLAPVLVGIAHDHGFKIGPDAPVYALFPEYAPIANWSEQKSRIKLEDFMNMASGLAIDDVDSASPGEESHVQEQKGQPDWCKYTLDLPAVREPGGDHPIYGSANINVVGCAVRNATSTWLPEFFDEYFARPLQIETYHMNLMPNGEAYAGGGLYMRPRDQLKLGQLYLSGGIWNGSRIVSQDWVKRSTIRHGDMRPRMDIDVKHGYGYGWHFRDCQANGRTFHYYWAGGNGGQLVIVVPELDMVVGFTGGDYTEFRKYLRWEIELMPQYIFSALH
jgi:CubicO group peptidase (beta-lactamase class C family)